MARRWQLRFGLTLVALTTLALWAALKLETPSLNFYALRPGEYYDTDGFTRRQGGEQKLDFAVSHAPPPIAAYGNHIIRYFGADAFGEPERAELFFNYAFANVSLPELADMLRHIEQHGRLTSKLMIVAITPPNADNGGFIVNRGDELPVGMALGDLLQHGHVGTSEFVATSWQTLELKLHEVFNYNTLLLSLLQNRKQQRRTGPVVCRGRTPQPAWSDRIHWAARHLFAGYALEERCSSEYWAWTTRRDGSVNPMLGDTPELDEDPLLPSTLELRAGDERLIVADLRTIAAIGERNGARVVFLITPVYESERSDSIANRVLDRALRLAPELTVIDDRGKHGDPSLFVNSLHPGAQYFRSFVGELRARGLLEGILPEAH